MIDSGLWQQIKSNPLALIVSVGLHLVLLAVLSISLTHTSTPSLPSKPQVKTVQAVVVDAAEVDKELTKLKNQEISKKNQEQARKERLERQMKQAEEKKRKAEENRRKEEKRLAALKKKQAAEAKAEKERQQKLAAERKKQQEELKALEEKRRKEQQRLAAIEEKRKAEEEAARKKKLAEEAEARRKAEEAELQRRLAEEERRQAELNSRLAPIRDQYIKMIEQQVEKNWLPPATMTKGWYCEVMVHQNVLGEVTNVQMLQCSGSEAFKNTVERAVMKASPLPSPPDPQVFDKRIQIRFSPKV